MDIDLFTCIIVFGVSATLQCIFMRRMYHDISDIHDRIEIIEQRQLLARYTPAHIPETDIRVAIPIDDPV